MSDWRHRSAAAACAVLVDRLVGDPADRFHPVAWFGRAMAWREARAWRDERRSGVAHLLAGLATAAVPVAVLSLGLRRIGALAVERAVCVGVVAVTLGAASLDRRAREVDEALECGRIDAARRLLPALVGRDPADLDGDEIARAVVESLAENTVDAVVAPLWWAVVGGPVAAAGYRAVNTLDAMVGYRDDRYRRFGWASARADDLANLVPARVAAVLVALCVPSRAPQILRAVRRQAPAHPSPNAGVIEAAFAAALGRRLGGTNRYGEVVEHRAELGEGPRVAPADIVRARQLARRVTLVATGALASPLLVACWRAPRTLWFKGVR